MQVLKLIATLMSLAIASLGVLGLAAPHVLLEFGWSLLAPPVLYAVAAVRIAFGALLIAVAGVSRAPIALRVFGVFIIVAGLLTPFTGVEHFGRLIAWLSGRLALVRGFAVVPLVLGSLLVYVINTNRRVAA